jgi:hypothetical protein
MRRKSSAEGLDDERRAMVKEFGYADPDFGRTSIQALNSVGLLSISIACVMFDDMATIHARKARLLEAHPHGCLSLGRPTRRTRRK